MINADDFGLNESVNRAVGEAFEKDLIDRTTLMVNMPGAVEAMKLAAEKGFADRVGLHLNLTAGTPLTKEIRKDPVMCDPEGNFSAEFARNLRTRFFLPSKTRKCVEAEIRAQFDEYARLGGTLWHIDSHHHVHTDPSVWSILKKVIRDYPVRSIRLGRNMYRGGNPLMHIYKTILNASIRKRCEGDPRLFGSAEDYENYMRCGKVPAGVQKEIMVHPVYDPDGNLSDVSAGKFRRLLRPPV